MYVVRLDVNGRIRIPAELRDKYGWTKGQSFAVEIVDEDKGEMRLKPVSCRMIVTDSSGEVLELE